MLEIRQKALTLALIAAALGLAAPRASPHSLGLSIAELAVTDGGKVDGQWTFATAEPLGGLPLDRDHDGVVSSGDVAAAQDDLRAFLQQGVGVSADERSCPMTFVGAELVAGDGLTLHATFACPADASEIELTLYYLSALGSGHREVARIVDGSAVASGVLRADARALSLTLPRSPGADARGGARRARGAIWLAGLAGFLGAAWLAARRWRGSRTACHNRRP